MKESELRLSSSSPTCCVTLRRLPLVFIFLTINWCKLYLIHQIWLPASCTVLPPVNLSRNSARMKIQPGRGLLSVRQPPFYLTSAFLISTEDCISLVWSCNTKAVLLEWSRGVLPERCQATLNCNTRAALLKGCLTIGPPSAPGCLIPRLPHSHVVQQLSCIIVEWFALHKSPPPHPPATLQNGDSCWPLIDANDHRVTLQGSGGVWSDS